MQQELTAARASVELLPHNRLVRFASGIHGPGDDAAREDEAPVAGKRRARTVDQRVLAGAARPDDQE
jgi:hypothetical protein